MTGIVQPHGRGPDPDRGRPSRRRPSPWARRASSGRRRRRAARCTPYCPVGAYCVAAASRRRTQRPRERHSGGAGNGRVAPRMGRGRRRLDLGKDAPRHANAAAADGVGDTGSQIGRFCAPGPLLSVLCFCNTVLAADALPVPRWCWCWCWCCAGASGGVSESPYWPTCSGKVSESGSQPLPAPPGPCSRAPCRSAVRIRSAVRNPRPLVLALCHRFQFTVSTSYRRAASTWRAAPARALRRGGQWTDGSGRRADRR